MTQKVWSCNEWDPLKEIIIGTSIGANIPQNILNRLKDAKNPLEEGVQIAAEQAKDFFNIADGVHLMAVKAEHLIPEILEKADLNLEY